MADVFTIKIDGKERDVKMTYNLLDTLCRAVGDLDGAAQIMFDESLRQGVLQILLAERDRNGKVTKQIELEEIEIDTDDLLEILDWAGNHIMDFFLKALERAKRMQDRNMPRLKALMPTSPGSAG